MRSSSTLYGATLFLLSAYVRADGTEASQAAIKDATAECAYYSYTPVANAMAATQFPPIWQPVSAILANDAEGQAKFSAMKANIPNIAPKGTLGVPDPNALSTYSPSDPDCWWSSAQCTTPKAAGVNPDIALVPEPETLGYGFDDGPNCSHNAFYDYLTQQKQKATFFYVGSNVVDWPLQAQRAVTDNHEVCVHSWSHRSMTAFTNEQVFGELWYTVKAIKLVTGYTPTCWRPPLGDVDDRVRFIAQQLGLTNVLWKYDSKDWESGENGVTPADVQNNYNTLINAAKSGAFANNGAIILAHELNNFTMQTAVDNYPALSSVFKHIVPVFAAMNKTQLYTETNYTGPSFAQYIGIASANSTSTASGAQGSASTSAKTVNSTTGAAQGTGAAVSNVHLGPASLVAALVMLSAAYCL